MPTVPSVRVQSALLCFAYTRARAVAMLPINKLIHTYKKQSTTHTQQYRTIALMLLLWCGGAT